MKQERFPDGAQGAAAADAAAVASLLDRLRTTDARAERDRILLALVREHVAAVVEKPGPMPPDAPFRKLGVYRAIAERFRAGLAAATGVRIPATLLFDYPTCAAVVRFLHDALLGAGEAEEAPAVRANHAEDPVVIVGMACRYAGGVHTPEALWQLAVSGRDTVTTFPANRGWDLENLYHPDPDHAGTCCTRHGSFLHDAPDFDAEVFGISPREALGMDPQQRMLLEVAWEAFEGAGVDPRSVVGRPGGVFVGIPYNHYGSALHKPAEGMQGQLLTGSLSSVASGRISYTFGLEGPAFTVDTACSSSLVALHLAVQALRNGECTMALAGGATVMSTPGVLMEFSRKRGLSPDGKCKAFSDDADGTGWGEGVGLLLLERLSDARRLGHRVLAVVAGSAINQDGASNGLTAPNGPSQQRVIRAALADAGIAASEVDLVEAHGTGTALGDPIEAQALLATYGRNRDADRPLWLGSIKSNIGHTQAAAGVAGVIKAVYAMERGLMPPTLHVTEPSTHVDWSEGAVELLTEARDWPAEAGRPRRAGVSAFGVSGTNAHVVLQQAPESEGAIPESATTQAAGTDTTPTEPPAVPLVVSGQSTAALAAQAARLAEFLTADPALSPADVGWSLASTRSALEHRAVLTCSDTASAIRALTDLAAGRPSDAVVSGRASVAAGGKVVFAFPGQGSQWQGMAVELLASSPVFAEQIARCEAALAPWVDWSLTGVLRGSLGAPGLDRVDVVQPVLFAVMVALAAVWRAAGVYPDAVVGHSQGEIAAAAVAGVLSLEDAARVVALRSRALLALAGQGGMVSLAVSRAQAQTLIEPWAGQLSVAAANGPASVVVSGAADALDALMARCEADDVRARRIDVDYASHSPAVDAVRDRLLEALGPITPGRPTVEFRSTVEGDLTGTAVGDTEYWFRNLRHTVGFEAAVRALAADGFTAFLEISPHPVTTLGIQQTLDDTGTDAVVTGTLRRDDGGWPRFTTSLGTVFAHGVDVDWPAVFGPGRRTVSLPTYAFQRRRYWLEAPLLAADAPAGSGEAVDARFWQAVRDLDVSGLAGQLAVEPENLASVLPALRSWDEQREQRSLIDSWRYRVVWRPLTVQNRRSASGTWLVVVPAGSEHEDSAAAIIAALERHGAEVRPVPVDPTSADRAAIGDLLREQLSQSGGTGTVSAVSGVLSLLALDERPHPEHPVIPSGVAANLLLVQGTGDAGIDAPLWCVTSGAAAVEPAEAPAHPAQAQIWGLGRVAALEYPQRWGGLVDLPSLPEAMSDTGALTEAVTDHLCIALTGPDHEDQIAIRATGIHTRRMVRAPHQGTAPDRAWTATGTVLITGGTGALGGHVARWLARNGAPRVILTSRRGADAPGAAELLQELNAGGTRAEIIACDLTDAGAVADLVHGLEIRGEAVRAVVHTAGVADLAPLADLSVAELASVASGKVAGALNLAAALDPAPLEAVVHFSSIAALWGVGDHGAYAAANAHLDALAQQQRAAGLPAHTIAWGPWAGGGMIADSLEETLNRRGVPLIAPDPAIRALQQILDHDDPAVAVADVDWERFAAVFSGSRPSPLLSELPEVARALNPSTAEAPAPDGATAGLARRLGGLTPVEAEQVLLDIVREHAGRILGYDSPKGVEPTRAFKELGFDSISALELRNGLNTATGVRLPATAVFDHPTPLGLARSLRTLLLGDRAADESSTTASTGVGNGAVTGRGLDHEPIAIVGMSCRYPGGIQSPEDLWRLVAAESDAVSAFPSDRGWDRRRLYDPDPDRAGTAYVREGGFLHDAADFDPAFFGISPREALGMDPQQRLLLEVAWEALESARINPRSLAGQSGGVFVGLADQAYGTRLQGAAEGIDEGYLVTGAASSVASGRISYLLGLEGPAITVDTACSSSLVALHLAVQSLRRGECAVALAGASMVMATPSQFVAFSRQRGLAADGRCKAFSESADGFGLAEGAGLLVLERLSDARANGHRVLAVVAGSAVNQDGASNGLTAPNGPSQQRVIRAALADARVAADEVDVVEAHGTGTTLGDPIEAQALLATYGRNRGADREPLWLGSIKSNIGHTQTAAGLAGVIKMVMAMRNGVLPKTLHVSEPSTHVDWSAGSVRLLTEAREWTPGAGARRAGVSAFGISGTNAHVILEQVPETAAVPAGEAGPEGDEPVLGAAVLPWIVTAGSGAGLRDQAGRLRASLDGAEGLDGPRTADVGYSLATTRAELEHRAVVLGRDNAALLQGLRSVSEGAEGALAEGVVAGRRGAVGKAVFVFPGQGSQWPGMGRELMDSSPVFRRRITECAQALAEFVDWDLTDVLREAPGAPALDRVDVVQPASWAVMVSLAAVWQSAGVRADAVIGHSQGEIAAACVAGVLTLQDAARVVALRSRALVALAGTGGMASVALPLDEVRARLGRWDGQLSVAAVNGVGSVVVSGAVAALDELIAACEADEVRIRRIDVDYASHSSQVEAIEAELAEVLAPVAPRPGSVPVFSTVDGRRLGGPEMDAGYWFQNLRRPVEFADAVGRAADGGFDVFVECSAHPVLTTAVAQTLEAAGQEAVVVGSLRRGEGGAERFLTSLAQAYVLGVDVDWPAVFGAGRRTVDLPTYAFQRQRYWLEALPSKAKRSSRSAADDRYDEVDSWRYRVMWRPLTVPNRRSVSGVWLVTVPAGPEYEASAATIIAALERQGADVVTLPLDTMHAERSAYRDLIREHTRGRGELAGVLSLLALDERAHTEHPSLVSGFAATIALSQALEDVGLIAPLWCVTSGAVSVDGVEPVLHPLQAQAWGLGIVAGLEYPQRWGGLVDLPGGLADGLSDTVTGHLCTALTGPDHEDQIAIRATGIHTRRLIRAPHEGTPPSRDWKPTGTVLITGGTGALGGHVARWLAANGAARVVLTSRRGAEAPGAAELLQQLGETGARAEIVACDLTDRRAVEQLLAGIGEEEPLTAVFHAAGVSEAAKSLTGLGFEDVTRVLDVKVTGARVLDEALADTPLDAFVMVSSGAGVWGNAGQTAYAAGNAFLDALAQHRRGRGQAATCVAWGAWGGGGMVDAGEAERLARHGLALMEPSDAIMGLQEALDHDDASVVVAQVDWERFAELYTLARPRPLIDGLSDGLGYSESAADAVDGSDSGDDSLETGLRAMTEDERRRELLQLVRLRAASTLGLPAPESVRASSPFRELGFDSLTAVDLRNQLNTLTGLRLPVTVVFDHPTPVALAQHLSATMAPAEAGSGAGVVLSPLDALDRLEGASVAVGADAELRRAVVGRLRGLLRRWDEGGDGAAADAELVAVTDEEMFDLIDRELGVE
nr:type I polyketide synthase [Catenulispora sp.]